MTDAPPPLPPSPPPAQPPSAAAPGAPPTSDEKTMALLAHVLAIVTGFIGPLVIWLIKKNESAYVDHHGKEALNFQITVFIASVVLLLPSMFLCGLPNLAVWVGALICSILAATKANEGVLYRYPFTLRLIS